jgi:GNAT superfamily N-acetyltransferase
LALGGSVTTTLTANRQPTIATAESPGQIKRCFPVMKQLREDLTWERFEEQMSTQYGEGYKLAFVESEGRIVAVAGFRILHMLASGKTLYVDDLVTDQAHRSQGFGETLVKWLIDFGRNSNCKTFSLDSGVRRSRAHRFYFAQGMHVSDFHFEIRIQGNSD